MSRAIQDNPHPESHAEPLQPTGQGLLWAPWSEALLVLRSGLNTLDLSQSDQTTPCSTAQPNPCVTAAPSKQAAGAVHHLCLSKKLLVRLVHNSRPVMLEPYL